MLRDDAVLADIVRFVKDIALFVAGSDEEAFRRDLKTQAAVLHRLLLMGEAVGRLSPRFKQDHPAIRWTRIRDFRNILIHEYDRVTLGRVWHVVQRELPALLPQLEALLPPVPSSDDEGHST